MAAEALACGDHSASLAERPKAVTETSERALCVHRKGFRALPAHSRHLRPTARGGGVSRVVCLSRAGRFFFFLHPEYRRL